MKNSASMSAVIATNRFGLGAKPGDITAAQQHPINWLKSQLVPVSYAPDLPTTAQVIEKITAYRKAKKRAKMLPILASTVDKDFHKKLFMDFLSDHYRRVIDTDIGLSWRLLMFWTNHFSVSARSPNMIALAPLLAREAISPNHLGQFEDLLLAVIQHPAMLIYLNNDQSIGPNSKMAKKSRGLNENLARELMELHTVGIAGGYTQTDVTELARGLTGWTANYHKPVKKGAFVFRRMAHEPGARKLLGKTYAAAGEQQGRAMLLSLARHPSTARFICGKLVRHFVSDKAPTTIVDGCVRAWQQSGGNIKAVMLALIEHPDSWHHSHQKFKTPDEFVISSLRGLALQKFRPRIIRQGLANMGQMPYKADSPEGYPDKQIDWDGAAGLMTRIEWASQTTQYLRRSPSVIAPMMLGARLTTRTKMAIKGAESAQQGNAMVLLSPEFQWR